MMMIAMMLCVGAGLRAPVARSGALMLLLVLLGAPGVLGVCRHCKDLFPNCPGGDDCPFFQNVAANVEAMAKGTVTSVPKLEHTLPPQLLNVFTRNVVEAIVAVACAPTVGGCLDFADPAYKTSTSVVRAAFVGHCSTDDAALELSERLEKAATGEAIARGNFWRF